MSSPVCPRPLGGQLHPIHRVVAVVFHDLGQAKVGDLDLTASRSVDKEDVAYQAVEERREGISCDAKTAEEVSSRFTLSLILYVQRGCKLKY